MNCLHEWLLFVLSHGICLYSQICGRRTEVQNVLTFILNWLNMLKWIKSSKDTMLPFLISSWKWARRYSEMYWLHLHLNQETRHWCDKQVQHTYIQKVISWHGFLSKIIILQQTIEEIWYCRVQLQASHLHPFVCFQMLFYLHLN